MKAFWSLTIVGLAATLTVRSQAQTSPVLPLPTFDVTERSIEELQKAMQAGVVTSRQLVDLYLARIDAYDKRGPSLNSIVSVNPLARDAPLRLMRNASPRARAVPSTAFPSS